MYAPIRLIIADDHEIFRNGFKLLLRDQRELELIGEAATGVSSELREQEPDVPWVKIIALRNRLIHGYFDVDLDIVWDTIQTRLPSLIETIEAVIVRHE
jgi:uncharacterized protein with HEPN domain